MNAQKKSVRDCAVEAAARIDAAQTWLEATALSTNDNFVSFAELCDFAEGRLNDPDGVIRRQIQKDPRLAESCRAILDEISAFQPLYAVAAADNKIEDIKEPERGFEIIFRAAASRDGVFHVIITFDRALWKPMPKNMTIFTQSGAVGQKLEIEEGRAHLLLHEGEDVLEALRQWRELRFA